jgi:hypothetical protein
LETEKFAINPNAWGRLALGAQPNFTQLQPAPSGGYTGPIDINGASFLVYARVAIDQVAAAPLRTTMNSRRLMPALRFG